MARSFSETRIVVSTGLALFAMFFGAGNILYPFYVGANAGQHFTEAASGFLIAGVGIPILGLLATSLYQGNYTAFFGRLGKIPAFLIITFLMIFIGPLAVMPRTETVTFNTLSPFLPDVLKNQGFFSLIYCGLLFLLACRENKIVDVLGLVLSPIKIVCFSCLVAFGLLSLQETTLPAAHSGIETFKLAISHGYNTMDLLATFFFCSVAFTAIQQYSEETHSVCNPTRLTLKACALGASLMSIVYLGFMFVAHGHAELLQGLAEEHMISVLSKAILGRFGGLFVCIAVSFACLATALALAEVTSTYLYREVFQSRVPRRVCLISVVGITYVISTLGFQGIMAFCTPILTVLYPALIVLCVVNIVHKARTRNL